jgi:small subunit ribosomal protein S16
VAVKIKLKRLGKIRAPYYRIVVADARTKRDGRAIEEIGKYHPKADPSLIEVDSERAQHWLSVGAQPTDPVRRIFEITGDWQKFKGLPGAEGTLQSPSPKVSQKEVFAEAVKQTLQDSGATTAKGRGRAKSAARDASAEAKAGEAKAGEAKAGGARAGGRAKDSGAKDSGAKDSGAKDSGAKDSGAKDSGAAKADSTSADAAKVAGQSRAKARTGKPAAEESRVAASGGAEAETGEPEGGEPGTKAGAPGPAEATADTVAPAAPDAGAPAAPDAGALTAPGAGEGAESEG